jgi:hypothetical protein
MMHFPPVSGGRYCPADRNLVRGFGQDIPSGVIGQHFTTSSLQSTAGMAIGPFQESAGSTGTTGTVYLKFTVNDEVKTAASATSPGYATFTVTPK